MMKRGGVLWYGYPGFFGFYIRSSIQFLHIREECTDKYSSVVPGSPIEPTGLKMPKHPGEPHHPWKKRDYSDGLS
jgi:hypothetical protein